MTASSEGDSAGDDYLGRWLASSLVLDDGTRLGLSFKDMCVSARISATDYHPTVGTFIFSIATRVWDLVAQKKLRRVSILSGLDGVVRSGQTLLVLGRPGSGCSTTLKALAGDTHDITIENCSEVNYQGIGLKNMHAECQDATMYQAELDVHFPDLTVGETLDFASRSKPLRKSQDDTAIGSATPEQSESRLVASMFGLTKVIHTTVGNDMIRGISGGEKKRLSIAEALIAGSPIQAWDNTTRGLDSRTALNIVKILKRSALVQGKTMLVSLYQASQAIYDEFDMVMLLYDGRQIYFGPAGDAVQYFESIGFVKSDRCTSADFLTSVTNPAERNIKDGFQTRAPRTAEDFARMWSKSVQHTALVKDIESFNTEFPPRANAVKQYRAAVASSLAQKNSSNSQYRSSLASQLGACLWRSWQRFRNNPVPVVAGIIRNTIVAIIISSVFYNLSHDTASFYKRSVLLFYSIVINAGISAFEVLTMWAARPVVEKQARYKFCHPFVESAASIICDLPNKLLTSLGFNLSIYFMTNLRRTPRHFFVFYLFSFTCLLTMSMFFRMVGSLSRTLEQSMTPVANLMLLFITYAGFVIPTRYMHPWLGWIRFINPIGYAYESLMINEFEGQIFPCSNLIPSGPSYIDVPSNQTTCSITGSLVGENFVSGDRYLEVNYSHLKSHLWRNFGVLVSTMILLCFFHLLAAEYIPAQRSKGEILRFRRSRKRPVHSTVAVDEENTRLGSLSLGYMNQKSMPHEIMTELNSSFFSHLQRQASVFHWSGISYEVPTKEGRMKVLDDVSGWVKPGTLTALMGITGAGKTSLLDALASRTSAGLVSGKAYIDGKPRTCSFQRQVGYVQQTDIHCDKTTVREALMFSALLRQPSSVSDKEKAAHVQDILQVLGMESYADAFVGIPGEGLNVEQRRRLSIGIELSAKPEFLLFLDEPTSGLDSQTAWSICDLLRRLADNGLAILCTIHQPSAQLFEMFDQLLLLGNGGKTLYFGDIGRNAETLITYYEERGSAPIKPGENPAEWVLDVTSSHKAESWPDVWKNSPQRQEALRHLAELEKRTEVSDDQSEQGQSEFSASTFAQLVVVTNRIFLEYWRDPTYVYSKIGLSVGVGFFNGFSFYMAPLEIQGLINILFSIFLLASIFNNVDQQIIPRFINGRQLFEAREGPSKTYSWVIFVASNIIVEAAWQTLTAVLLFIVWYFPTGLWRNGNAFSSATERGGLMFGLLWIFCIFMSTVSQAIAAGIEHAETAVQMAQLVSSLWLIFCGILVPHSDMPGFWTFMYRLAPHTYLIAAMASTGIGDLEVTCSADELLRFNSPSSQTCIQYFSKYLEFPGVSGRLMNPDTIGECQYCPMNDTNSFLSTFGINVNNRWRDFGLQFAYVSFNILSVFLLYWLVRIPKDWLKHRGSSRE